MTTGQGRALLSLRRVSLGAVTGMFVCWLLTPTAWLFFELYHLLYWDPLYIAYGLFHAAGYYFGIWPWRYLASLGLAILIAVPWWRLFRRFFQAHGKLDDYETT